MAARGWANSTVAAIGAAAGVGAAQLGLGYGLGIIVWQPVGDAAGESLWLTSLAWVAWIGASSTVVGAVYASANRRGGRGGRPRPAGAVELAWRTTIAVAAAIGACVSIPLVMLPARAAHRADTFQPQVTAGAYAVIGIVTGLVIAIVAVNVRVIAANVVASTAWVWGLAAVAVIDAVRAHRTVGTAQLAAWQFTESGWFRQTLYVPGALLMLGGALLVGVFAALPADRREDSRVGIAISGAVGPLLVAAAYFLAAPKLTVRAEQLSAYLFAPYAVLAGVAGSVLVAALGPMRPRRAKPAPALPAPAPPLPIAAAQPVRPAPPAQPTPPPARSESGDLTDWTRTLADAPDAGEKRPAGAETTVRLDAKGTDAATTGTDPRADELTTDSYPPPRGYPSDETVPARTATDPAGPTATGRATVTQPLWPDKPKPRKRRG
jgi:hypothetical protein